MTFPRLSSDFDDAIFNVHWLSGKSSQGHHEVQSLAKMIWGEDDDVFFEWKPEDNVLILNVWILIIFNYNILI